MRYLAPYLADQGWEVTVYGRKGAIATVGPRDERVTARLTSGLETRSLSTLSYGLTASLAASRNRPDVVLMMNVANGYFLPFLRARGIPTVVNVDGIEWEREKWGRAARAMFRNGARATAKFASELVADSHAIGDYWREHYSRDGKFIPYGGEAPSTELPVEEGLEHGKYVLFVARFVPENSFHEFMAAVPQMAEESDVVIVGSSGYGGDLDKRAADLARDYANVRWLGHVSDDVRIQSLWQHCGAYFHGHSVGGTNPALVQAMACGAPVVARDTVYNREVLGDAGVFVPARPDAIADALRDVLKVDQTARVARARKRIDQTYNWEAVCSSYERLLTETAGR
ncbi:glycosyltransferase [Demequina sp.]|uniref:glycosyltransferase n=1 Tax=Demequina sp. TaxID=2050685 RepID=UPI0025BF83ED|nr:glycosyltransferase [Demequina sp.]